MYATNQVLRGKWHELKGQARQKWGKLTDDDLARMSGRIEELTGALQQRYGYGKAQAELDIKEWLHGRAKEKEEGKDHE